MINPPPNRTINVASGGTALVGRTTPISTGGGGAIPAYIAAAPLMTAGVVPNSQVNAPPGMMAYSGFVYAEGMLINPGFGGHHDASSNAVDGIDVTANAPVGWVNLCPATPLSQRTSDAAYYANGLPSAPHGYYTPIYVPSRREIWRMGKRSTWSDPELNGSTPNFLNIDIFDMVTRQWRPATTPSLPNPVGPVPNLPLQNGGAVMNNAGLIFSGSVGVVTDPATGLSRNRAGTGPSVPRYPQANNPDGNYILSFTYGDGLEGSLGLYDFVAHILIGENTYPMSVNASAAAAQFKADQPFAYGLQWVKPLGKWLCYTSKGGRQNTLYALAVDTVAKTIDVSILTIAGTVPPNTSGSGGSDGGVFTRFAYVDALGTLFFMNDISVGVNFVRIA